MEVTARNSNRAAQTKIYFKQFNISQSPPNHQFGYQKKKKNKTKEREKLINQVPSYTFSQQPNKTYKYI
jgi:hypothetical protein